MRKILPKPTEVELVGSYKQKINQDKFQEGYEYGLRCNQLTDVSQLKYSFAMGFRKAKLEQRELRRKAGIINFPHSRFKTTPTE